MIKLVIIMLSVLLYSMVAVAQEESLSKKLANPLAAMINVPTQINYEENLGVNDGGSLLQINVQPVYPYEMNSEWNLISRTIFPLIKQEDITRSSGEDTGMGDILQSVFFSPIQPTGRGWIWGAGPVLLLPTATDDALGADQWALGPTVVALKQEGPWTTGILANHLWTISGENDIDSERAENLVRLTTHRGTSLSLSHDINSSYIEPWISFAAQRGTTFSLSTESSYDWNASQWLVPIVLTADHLFDKGPKPFSVGVAAKYWAESPEGGPQDWSVRLQFTFLFLKS